MPKIKLSILLLLICHTFSGCKGSLTNKLSESKDSVKNIGTKIMGDFDGDGQQETAFIVKMKEGKGNCIETGICDEFEVRFSNPKLPPIKVGCCDPILINEGDLYKNGRDAISILRLPENGCMDMLYTYSYENGNWKMVLNFFIPSACDGLSDSIINHLVFRSNDKIYYMCYDLTSNPDTGIWVQKLVLPNSTGLFLDMYNTYCNKKLDLCIYYPNGFTPVETQEDNRQIFKSEDKKSEIDVWNDEPKTYDIIDSFYKSSTKDMNVTYKVLKNDWFVFSGLDKDGNIIYQKSSRHILNNEKVFQNLRISYPKANNKDYKQYCSVIATSF